MKSIFRGLSIQAAMKETLYISWYSGSSWRMTIYVGHLFAHLIILTLESD